MKTLTKKITICILFTLFASGQTLQAWPTWSSITTYFKPKLSFSSFNNENTKKLLIPLGALALTGLAAYGIYKWCNRKPTLSATTSFLGGGPGPGQGPDAMLTPVATIPVAAVIDTTLAAPSGSLDDSRPSTPDSRNSSPATIVPGGSPDSSRPPTPLLHPISPSSVSPLAPGTADADLRAKEAAQRLEAVQAVQEEARKAEADRKAKEDAERKAEADRQAKLAEEQRIAAERQAKIEAEQARQEAERRTKEEADRKTREAERKAEEEAAQKAEADRKAKEEARLAAQRAAERQAKLEAEQARLEAQRKAEAERKAKEERDKQAAEAKRRAEEQSKKRAEEEAKIRAAEQARIETERKAKEEARIAAERQAQLEAEQLEAEQARIAAQQAKEAAERQAREEARLAAQRARENTDRKAREAEQARQEAERQAKLAEEQRIAAEKQAQKAEAKKRAEEEAKIRAAEQARIETERKEKEERDRKAAEQKAKEEAKRQAQLETERKAKAEADAKRRANEQKAREEAERIKKAKEAAERKVKEEARLAAQRAAEQKAKEAADRLEVERKAKAEADAKRRAEEQLTASPLSSSSPGSVTSTLVSPIPPTSPAPDLRLQIPTVTATTATTSTTVTTTTSATVVAAAAALTAAAYQVSTASSTIPEMSFNTSATHTQPAQKVVGIIVCPALNGNKEEIIKHYAQFIKDYAPSIPSVIKDPEIKIDALAIDPRQIDNAKNTILDKIQELSGDQKAKVIAIAYGDCAKIIDHVSQKQDIDTIIHLQPTIDQICQPQNFRRLYNIYSREGMQSVRKYKQKATHYITMPVKNIRVVTTAQYQEDSMVASFVNYVSDCFKDWNLISADTQRWIKSWITVLPNALINYDAQNFMKTEFIKELSALLDSVEENYKLNFDLIAKIDTTPLPSNIVRIENDNDTEEWILVNDEQSPKSEKRPEVLINRFVELSQDKGLVIYAGAGTETYTVCSLDQYSIEATKQLFTKEYQRSKTQLHNFMTNIVEQPLKWDTLNEFIQRYNAAENSLLYFRPDIKLQDTIVSGLDTLQIKTMVSRIPTLSVDFAKQQIVNGAKVVEEIPKVNWKTDYKEKRQEYLQKILEFSWLLYGFALSKNQLFTEGTFVIRDPGFNIYNFLSSYRELFGPEEQRGEISYNPFAYNRVSSHFKPETKELKLKYHYGIDIRFTERSYALSALPGFKRHILFSKLNNTDLIYIKFENYGTYAYDGFVQHAGEFIDSLARKLGLSKTSDDDPDFRKERVVGNFVKAFNQIVDSPSFTFENKDALKKRAKDKGIQVLHQPDLAGIKEFDALRAQYDKPEYDYPQMRWGREVIIMPGEIKSLSAAIRSQN